MTSAKKRRQMLLLEEGMYKIRMDFNKRFLALRDVKKRIVQDISTRNKRLQVINTSLGTQGKLPLAKHLCRAK
jgi:hypothetical protein